MIKPRTTRIASLLIVTLAIPGLLVAKSIFDQNAASAQKAANGKRLKAIQSQYTRTKQVVVWLPKLWFRIGSPILITKRQYVEVTPASYDQEKSPLFQHLWRRYVELSELEGVKRDGGLTASSFDKPARVRRCVVFGVSAVELKDAKGKIRYFAEGLALTPDIIFSSDPNKEPAIRDWYANIKRSDFVNPEDADWIFGVDDFMAIQAN